MKQKNAGKNTSLGQCENITDDNSEVDSDNDHSAQRPFFSHLVCVSLIVNVALKCTVNVCVYIIKYPLSLPFFYVFACSLSHSLCLAMIEG